MAIERAPEIPGKWWRHSDIMYYAPFSGFELILNPEKSFGPHQAIYCRAGARSAHVVPEFQQSKVTVFGNPQSTDPRSELLIKLVQKQWKVSVFRTPNPLILGQNFWSNWSKNSENTDFLFFLSKHRAGNAWSPCRCSVYIFSKIGYRQTPDKSPSWSPNAEEVKCASRNNTCFHVRQKPLGVIHSWDPR